MTYNPSGGMYGPGRHTPSERDDPCSTPLDPSFGETAASNKQSLTENHHQLQQFMEENYGKNSTQWPPLWDGHADNFSAQDLATFPTFGHGQYLPPGSSPSQNWSSTAADSVQNVPFERDPPYDPDTPETRLLSPATELDSPCLGASCLPQFYSGELDYPSRPQGEHTDMLYDYQTYGGTGGLVPSLELHMQKATSLDGCYFDPVPTPPATMTTEDTGVNSPIPNITSTMIDVSTDCGTSYKVEEKEILVNYKSPRSRSGLKGTTTSTRAAANRVGKPQSRVPQKRPQKQLTTPESANLVCRLCDVSFRDEGSLDKHVKTKHTRPFICVFHYAGCNKTFATKNEWKRHVSSQHLYLEYYHCDYRGCETSKPAASKRRFSNYPKYGITFNRKDLYTQHARRMHQPDSRGKKGTQQWERQLEAMQKRAFRKRCELPREMYCPAFNCNQRFLGEKAWDERMEHVARHLELAASGKEHPVSFGGLNDLTLANWAESPEVDIVKRVDGGWELSYPVKGAAGKSHYNTSSHSALDEDAEGEDY